MHHIKFSQKETNYLKSFFAESEHELADPNVVDDVSVLPKGTIQSFNEALNYWFLNQHVSESTRDLVTQLREGEPINLL